MYPMYHTIPNHIRTGLTKLQASPMEAKCYVNDGKVLKERRSCVESVENGLKTAAEKECEDD